MNGEWLAAVEAKQRVELPAMCEFLRSPGGTRNLIGDLADEGVAGIEVGVTVVPFEVEVVLWKSSAIAGDFIEVVAPRVDDGRGDVMPVLQAELGLEGVVVGGSDAFDLVDVAISRILIVVRTCSLTL